MTQHLYRKKPVVIEAVQWYPDVDLPAPFDQAVIEKRVGHIISKDHRADTPFDWWAITTLEGEMRIEPGDWLIRGVKGEFYACRDDIFTMTYEQEPRRGGES
jgi:hypothetical protein